MISRSVATLPALALAALVYAQPPATEPTDHLNRRYPTGVVAIAEGRVITVADVRREVAPLLAGLQKTTPSQPQFDQKVVQLEDSVAQDLIDRVLVINEFRRDESKSIPPEYVDNRIADIISEKFSNDRAQFLADLRTRNQTLTEYRKIVEEDIIYHYMVGQHRKSPESVSPARVEAYYAENRNKFHQDDRVHLRLIQLPRNTTDTDATLSAQGEAVLQKLRAGQKFENLVQEYSVDTRRNRGGDWGWIKRSELKPAFSDPVFALKAGEAAAPVVLPEGCFILFAEERQYEGQKSLDEVRGEIERTLQQQQNRADLSEWLERLRRNGSIQRN